MRVRAFLCAGLLFAAVFASAEVITDKASGIAFDVPSWWKMERRQEGIVMATSDGALVVMVWTPRTGSLEDAVRELDVELSKVIQNAKPEKKPQQGNLNGMQTLSISGRGRINRAKAEYSVLILQAKKPVIVLAFGETGKWEKHADALTGFLQSFKRR